MELFEARSARPKKLRRLPRPKPHPSASVTTPARFFATA